MHPSSSFLNARVSTYDPCLQLPSEPMKSLLAWMPGKCSINELSRMFCDHLPYVPGQQVCLLTKDSLFLGLALRSVYLPFHSIV